jgi:hypothetical protein
MLFAQGRGTALAMACTVPWRNASAGFVGYSDGWQMLSRNGKLDPIWTRAQNGNVALIGEIDFTQADEVTLALGFGQHPEEAAQWSTDGWRTTHDDPTRDTGLGVHVVDVPGRNACSRHHHPVHAVLDPASALGGNRLLG